MEFIWLFIIVMVGCWIWRAVEVGTEFHKKNVQKKDADWPKMQSKHNDVEDLLDKIRQEEQRRLEEERRKEFEQKLKEEFFSSYDGKSLKDVYCWMCLAGGTDPFLRPHISFSPANWTISIEKKGYDLWIENLQQYYHGTVWEEREAALKRFERDLFEDKLDDVRDIINIEYIADHLITLENCRRYEADFTLKWSTMVSKDFFATYSKEFVRQELESVSFQQL